jgi:hypothetical protein
MIVYGKELLAARPTPKLEDHPLLAVCDCLFSMLAATLHIWRPFHHPQPSIEHKWLKNSLFSVLGTLFSHDGTFPFVVLVNN